MKKRERKIATFMPRMRERTLTMSALQSVRITSLTVTAFVVLGCVVLSISSASRSRTLEPSEATVKELNIPMTSNAQPEPANQPGYVRRAYLRPEIRNILSVNGDRFETQGKERLVLTGTLVRPDADNQPHSYRLITQLGGKLRLEESVGGQLQVIVFNRGPALKAGGALTARDQEILETLAFDSVDHFLTGQMDGVALRFLGGRFRLDGGTNEDYTGPVYDVYQLSENVRVGAAEKNQVKLFLFNTNSLLLEKVQYDNGQSGASVTVDVELGNWTRVNGQLIPGSIARKENGQTVLALTVNSVAITAGADDGIFDRP
jgi:hypothetical protein